MSDSTPERLSVLAAGLLLMGTALGGGLSACGEPLVDGDYHGEALFELEGSVLLQKDYWETLENPNGAPFPPGELRLAVFWATNINGPSSQSVEAVDVVEQQAVTTTSFPAKFKMSLFTPPPAELLAEAPEGEGEVALGLVLVYTDKNGDGRWTREEDALVGGAPAQALVYTPGGASSPQLGDLSPGYQRLRVREDPDLCSEGRLPLEKMPNESMSLLVDPLEPTEFFLDFDCDGFGDEWWEEICVPETFFELCHDTLLSGDAPEGLPGPWECSFCLNEPDVQDVLFEQCLQWADENPDACHWDEPLCEVVLGPPPCGPIEPCQAELEACFQRTPPEDHEGCFVVFDECAGTVDPFAHCEQVLSDCLGQTEPGASEEELCFWGRELCIIRAIDPDRTWLCEQGRNTCLETGGDREACDTELLDCLGVPPPPR